MSKCAALAVLVMGALVACDAAGVAPDVGVIEQANDISTPTEPWPDTTTEPPASDTAVTEVAAELVDHAEVDDAPDVPAAPAPTFELTMGGFTLAPGKEATRCVLVRLPNDRPIRVHRIRTSLSRGSHHLIAYRAKATWEQHTPYPCTPFTEFLGGDNVPFAISQIREETIELPDGVAYEFPPGQVIRLEAHYLNYFTENISADVKVWLDTVPEDRPTEKADVLFFGNIYFSIPAGAQVTSNWTQIDVPEGLTVFAMTGHTHALGTGFEVERSASWNQAGPVVYPPAGAEFSWSDPPVAWFDPPLEFTEPGDGFRFRCHWNNTTKEDVDFGESATQEMCFLWGYYWPSQGALIRLNLP